MGAGYGSGYTQAPQGAARTSGGNNAWLFYIAAFVMIILGYGQLKDFLHARTAQSSWTATSGVVSGHNVRRVGRKSPHTYNTYITYSYEIGGYWNSGGPLEVNRNTFYMSEDSARGDLADSFPEGGSLTVYYNPSNPSDSSLGTGAAPGLAAPIVFFILAGITAFIGREQT